MLHLVVATTRPQALEAFTTALTAAPEVRLILAASGAAALEAVGSSPMQLVIVDAKLPDLEPLELVQKLLLVNAMVNTAVVSPLSEEEFHEASEGLGVLGRLPLEPGAEEAAGLLQKLRKILGIVR